MCGDQLNDDTKIEGRMREVSCWNMPNAVDHAEADLHYFQEGLWYWGIDAEEELSLRRKRVEWAKQVVRETMTPFE